MSICPIRMVVASAVSAIRNDQFQYVRAGDIRMNFY